MRKDTVARAVWFTAPNSVEIIEDEANELQGSRLSDRGVEIRSICSGISAGTEMLLYQGKVPQNIPLDNWAENKGATGDDSLMIRYPVKYGYCNVGRVVETGPDCLEMSKKASGDIVFTFHPHETRFTTSESACTLIPKGMDPHLAVFLANMETAIGIVHDSEVRLGETVAIFGLGVVGLLIAGLLVRRSGAGCVVGIDPIPFRRKLAEECMGVRAAFSTVDDGGGQPSLPLMLPDTVDGRPDLIIEVSGSPTALQQAIDLAGRETRIVVGSWYGDRESALNLGRTFHRNRIRMQSSQVSHINPSLSGRWDKRRRLALALSLLKEIPVSPLITDVFPFERAAEAYRKISEKPEETLQVILEYS